MSNSVQNVGIKSGTCPHGASPAACPICSGMGGGRVGERPQKAGEMSYHECAMIGAMMKARAEQAKLHEQTLQHRADALKAFVSNLESLSAKMAEFASNIGNTVLLKPVAAFINIFALPLLSLVKNIPNWVSNTVNFLSQLKFDIQDKLNAVFGEIKNFINKKISELVSSVKNGFKNLFKIFKKNNSDDDDTKIDEDKKIFNLKTLIQKIRKKKDDSEDKSGS